MSTRRTRQELIEQGVLKEVPDNGKSASVIHLISAQRCLYLTVAALRLSHPHRQYSEVISTLWQENCPPIQQVSETYIHIYIYIF